MKGKTAIGWNGGGGCLTLLNVPGFPPLGFCEWAVTTDYSQPQIELPKESKPLASVCPC